MVEVHERYIRSLEQSGALNRELEFLPSDEVLRRAQGRRRRPHRARVRDPALVHEDRACRTSCSPPTSRRTRTSRPSSSATSRRASASGSASSSSATRCGARSSSRASSNDLVNRAGTTFAFRLRDETGAGAGRHRPRVHGRPRDLRRCAASGPRSRRSTASRRRDAGRDAAQGARPARAGVPVAAAQPPPAARHRRDDRALRAGRGGARGGRCRALLGPARSSRRPQEHAEELAGGRRARRRSRSASPTSRRSCPRSTSSRSPRRPGSTWPGRRGVLRARLASRAALAPRPDRRAPPRDALGGDGPRRASRRRLRRAGGR